MSMTGYVLLIPLRGKINLGPRPQNKILVPFRGNFQKIRRAPPSLLYGIPPPPRGSKQSKRRGLHGLNGQHGLSDYIMRLTIISIILKLYSPRYPVNITLQGVAAQLSHIFRVLFITFLLVILYFLMFKSENHTKKIIRLRLSKYWRIFTSPTAR